MKTLAVKLKSQVAHFFERGWDRAWDKHPDKRTYISERKAECTIQKVLARADEAFYTSHPELKTL